jgi:predicted PurR-regulated permease PerM
LQSDLLVLLQSWNVPIDISLLADALPLGSLLTLAGSALRSLGAVLSNGFLIILTVIFILAEAASFYPKLRAVLANPDRDLAHFGRITGTMNRYIAIKTSVSVLTGILVTSFLWILDVDFPVLWGLVALLLNFIPTIGSIIAGIPPVLLALVQLGPAEAGLVVLGFFLVNTIVGNVLEPRYMGQGLGLSALIVFVSLIFWGWLFGPVGMLLSVPLTMSAKIALEASPSTLWLARLLAPANEIRDLTPSDSGIEPESLTQTPDRDPAQ